jgi:hypothetical protein
MRPRYLPRRFRLDWYTTALAVTFCAGWVWVFWLVIEDLAR